MVVMRPQRRSHDSIKADNKFFRVFPRSAASVRLQPSARAWQLVLGVRQHLRLVTTTPSRLTRLSRRSLGLLLLLLRLGLGLLAAIGVLLGRSALVLRRSVLAIRLGLLLVRLLLLGVIALFLLALIVSLTLLARLRVAVLVGFLLIIVLFLLVLANRLLLALVFLVLVAVLLDVYFVSALDNIVAASRDLDRRVVRLGVLLDLIAALGRDADLAGLFDLVDGAPGTRAGPLPRDWAETSAKRVMQPDQPKGAGVDS